MTCSRIRVVFDPGGLDFLVVDFMQPAEDIHSLSWQQTVNAASYPGAAYAGVVALGNTQRELPFSRVDEYADQNEAESSIWAFDATIPQAVAPLEIRALDVAAYEANPADTVENLTAATYLASKAAITTVSQVPSNTAIQVTRTFRIRFNALVLQP